MRVFIAIIVLSFGSFLADVVAQDPPPVPPPAPKDSIIAPNVFTPNGDGINDIFEVRSKEGNKVILNIYTRAGVLVYSITAERCRWDGYSLSGQKMATGVYYFTAEILDSSPKITRKSFFHLYR